MGATDRGADLTWLSQYPHEEEILFAPLTSLEVMKIVDQGEITEIELRLNVNGHCRTLSGVRLCLLLSASSHTALLFTGQRPLGDARAGDLEDADIAHGAR